MEPTWTFIKKHYLKLFRLLFIGYVVFILFDVITHPQAEYHLKNVVGLSLMVVNLFPLPEYNIPVGPYWYFGLMVQCYVLYRIILCKLNSRWLIAIALLLTVAQYFFRPTGHSMEYYRYNFMGSALPFILGILSHRHEQSILTFISNKWSKHSIFWAVGIFVLTTLLIFLCSLNFYTWVIVPALICIGSVVCAWLITALNSFIPSLGKSLLFLGTISAAIFILHPTARGLIIHISNQGAPYTGLVVYVMITLGISSFFYHVVISRQASK